MVHIAYSIVFFFNTENGKDIRTDKKVRQEKPPHLRMLNYYSIFLLFCQTFLYGFKKVFFLISVIAKLTFPISRNCSAILTCRDYCFRPRSQNQRYFLLQRKTRRAQYPAICTRSGGKRLTVCAKNAPKTLEHCLAVA